MNDNSLAELFDELFGTEEEQEEASQYNFTSESDIDDSIETLKSLDIDIKRFKDLFAEKVEKLKGELEGRISKLDKRREWILFNLKNSVIESGDAKETKTMFKKSYLSGDIIIKKSITKLIKPELSQKQILDSFQSYKKEDYKVSLDWVELKKNLKILNGRVLDTSSGEDLTDTILTETIPEIVTVK